MPSTVRAALGFLALPERHRYGSHREQRADLYLPRGPGPHRVVVLIHGGYWQAKWGKVVMKAACADLARRGFAAWNIEYRRIGRGGGWPETFDDVGAAIDHLGAIADGRLMLDDVTVVGHSAGGQLALWSASRNGAKVPVRLVVAQAAVCNLAGAGPPAHELMGGTPQEVPERYALGDPMQLIPAPVPVRLVHGAEDATVPVARSRDYLAAARRAGADVELVEPSPCGHRSHPDPRTPAWAAAVELLLR